MTDEPTNANDRQALEDHPDTPELKLLGRVATLEEKHNQMIPPIRFAQLLGLAALALSIAVLFILKARTE
jgi:hypothetical protein